MSQVTAQATAQTMPAPQEKPTFGFNPRPRRKARPACTDTRSTEELTQEFLAKNQVKKYPPRHADGAVANSGYYDF